MYDSAIIKYSCRLMKRRMAIGMGAINRRKNLSDAEKLELEWINIKLRLIRQVQITKSCQQKEPTSAATDVSK